MCSELGEAACRWPLSRLMSLCDSRVACGALAKGRSSSSALNRPLRKLAANMVAFDCHAGVCFVPTRIMPADGPSRGRPAPGPRSAWPWWADALANGEDLHAFDLLAILPKQSFKYSEWARLVIKLVFVRREFDSTLGYPGEGPGVRLARFVVLLLLFVVFAPVSCGRPQALSPAGRPPVDLRGSRVRTSQVADRRLRFLLLLESWLFSTRALRWERFTNLTPRRAGEILAEAVQWLYDTGRPFSDASEMLNAVSEQVKC